MYMTKQNEFLQPLLDLMQQNHDELKHEVSTIKSSQDEMRNIQSGQAIQLARIEDQTNKTNGRVTHLEKQLAKVETSKGKKIKLPSDGVLKLLALSFVILLVIVASVLRVPLGGLLK